MKKFICPLIQINEINYMHYDEHCFFYYFSIWGRDINIPSSPTNSSCASLIQNSAKILIESEKENYISFFFYNTGVFGKSSLEIKYMEVFIFKLFSNVL